MGSQPYDSLNSRRQRQEAERNQRYKEQVVSYINDYCNDLNWGRARNLIENNLQLLQDPAYRLRLNSEAIALLETIEITGKENS